MKLSTEQTERSVHSEHLHNETKKVPLSIIIPAYNEEGSLERTVRGIISKVHVPNYELLICNDHSTDNTLAIAKKLEKANKPVRVLTNTGQNGFGNVMRFGFLRAKGEFVLPMMADLCDDPMSVNHMFERTKRGYDVVVGSRYMRGGGKKNVMNKFKSFSSWFTCFLTKLVIGIPTHDATNAFKIMRRSAVLRVMPKSNYFDISYGLSIRLFRKGYKISQVPTIWTDRSAGMSQFKLFAEAKRYMKWLFY